MIPMPNRIHKLILITISLFFLSSLAVAQKVTEPANNPVEWSKPYPPFRIAGNLFYVGTADLACYLITTPSGHILINTGLAGSASLIESSIKTLGFNFKDVKILLTTQAHFDHMGAMASIKKLTGAKMMVDAKDAQVMADGGSSDYALGSYGRSYEPLKADRLLQDHDIIKLGTMQVTMLHHPGHTKGSCSFLFDVKDKTKSYKVLIANLPSIVTSKNFSKIPAYPDVAKDYAYTLNIMKKISFDIWLSSHASQFDLAKKHKPGDPYNPTAFIDRKGYDKAINDLQKQFSDRLKQE
jgi:metallo-beta-lactamase class B